MFDDKQFYIFFCNPIHKTEIGTGQGLLIANQLDQSLWQASEKETLSSSQIIFIKLFLAGAQWCNCKFYQPLQIVQLCWVEPNGQDHIWTTAGDGLRAVPFEPLWIFNTHWVHFLNFRNENVKRISTSFPTHQLIPTIQMCHGARALVGGVLVHFQPHFDGNSFKVIVSGGPVIVSGVQLLRTYWCAQNRCWKEGKWARSVICRRGAKWARWGDSSPRSVVSYARGEGLWRFYATEISQRTTPKIRSKKTDKQTKTSAVTNCEDGFRSCVSRVSSTYY